MSRHTVRRLLVAFVPTSIGFLLVASVLAQPQIPATYFGTATIDGANVPDGTPVRAFVNGKDCTQPNSNGTITDGGVSSYVIFVMHESQQEGCGAEGDLVSFAIGETQTPQTSEWTAGIHELNLNAGAGDPVPLPTATETPTVDPADATAAALRTPENSGPPPTDDPNVLSPTIGDAVVLDDEGSSSLLAWTVVVLGLLALGGAAAGWALSRKRA